MTITTMLRHRHRKPGCKLLASLFCHSSLRDVHLWTNQGFQLVLQIYEQLMAQYVDPPCPLDHANSFQLLCSVILSAQVLSTTQNKLNCPVGFAIPERTQQDAGTG